MQSNILNLLEPVLTVSEADDLTERLAKARQELHRESGAQALKSNLTAGEYDRLMNFLKWGQIKAEEALEQWGKNVGQTKIMQLKLPFEPRQIWLEELKEYLAKYWETMTPFRLKIETDSRLVGGVIVGWEGRIYDKSWGEKIQREIKSLI